VCSVNKTTWVEICIKKVSADSLFLLTTQFKQWSSKYSAFFNLLDENKNHNINSEYSNWHLTQIKRAFKTDNREEQCSIKCIV